MSIDHEPGDSEDFQNALTAFLQQAHASGTDVEGAWKCAVDDESGTYWDVQITRAVHEEPED